jgi:hypothetical protein
MRWIYYGRLPGGKLLEREKNGKPLEVSICENSIVLLKTSELLAIHHFVYWNN